MENIITNPSLNQSESSSEVIGLLTAISIVSKRMARKLALLDQLTTAGRSDARHERAEAAAEAADQGHAL